MENKTTTPQLIAEIHGKRGGASTNFAVLESSIAKFVVSYYFKGEPSEFLADVFEDEYFSFGLLMNVFEKVLKKDPELYKKFPLQKLRRLQKIRNIIVHAQLQSHAMLDKNGEIQEMRESFFHHAGKDHDVDEIFREYEKLRSIVQPAIMALSKQNKFLELS